MTATATAPQAATPDAKAPDLHATEDAPDFDGKEREAAQKVEELRAERQRLALPALSDAKAAQELATVQAALAAALVDVENITLARQQAHALAEQAERQRVEAVHAEARREAVKLQGALRAAAVTFDNHAAQLAESLCAFAATRVDLLNALNRADEKAPNIPASAIEAGLVFALHRANCPRGALEFAGIAARPQALAASVPSLRIEDDES